MKQFLIDTDILQYVDFYIGKEENQNTEFQMYLEVLKERRILSHLLLLEKDLLIFHQQKSLG